MLQALKDIDILFQCADVRSCDPFPVTSVNGQRACFRSPCLPSPTPGLQDVDVHALLEKILQPLRDKGIIVYEFNAGGFGGRSKAVGFKLVVACRRWLRACY